MYIIDSSRQNITDYVSTYCKNRQQTTGIKRLKSLRVGKKKCPVFRMGMGGTTLVSAGTQLVMIPLPAVLGYLLSIVVNYEQPTEPQRK